MITVAHKNKAKMLLLWQDPIYRKRMSDLKKGKPSNSSGKHWKQKVPRSVEHREKIKIWTKGNPNGFKKGNKIMLGRKLSLETRTKIGDAQKGEKNVNWKGGISKNKSYFSWMSSKRRIKKLGNGGSHTQGEWETLKAQYNWTCPCCGKVEPKIKLTEDHIIPLSKGGSDNIENIQPLCKSCNSQKHDKIIKYNL